MRKVIDRSAAKATSLDIRGTNDLLNAAVKNLTVDNSFGLDTMLALGREFKAFSGDQMVSHTAADHAVHHQRRGRGAQARHGRGGADLRPLQGHRRGPRRSTRPTSPCRCATAAGSTARPPRPRASCRRWASSSAAPTPARRPPPPRRCTTAPAPTTRRRWWPSTSRAGPRPRPTARWPPGEVRLVLGKDYGGIVDDAGKTVVSSPKSTASTTTTADPTTITEEIGHTPGSAPPGVTCG